MTTYRLDIAYTGGDFRGWAIQPDQRTVQGELEAALSEMLRVPVALVVAGRTDAGVHARAQVASFETEAAVPKDLRRRINGMTPPAIAILAAGPVADGFSARRDAISRSYGYRLMPDSIPDPFEKGRALWWPYPLDLDLLQGCAAVLPGRHNFSAFTPTDTAETRFERDIVAASWGWEGGREESGILVFSIEGNAFVHKMVRIMVGTMLEVGGAKRTPDSFAALLKGADRAEAGDTAAAHGLYLTAVRYPDHGP